MIIILGLTESVNHSDRLEMLTRLKPLGIGIQDAKRVDLAFDQGPIHLVGVVREVVLDLVLVL